MLGYGEVFTGWTIATQIFAYNPTQFWLLRKNYVSNTLFFKH
ncbi:hypothetical protein VDIAB_270761 [Vibrio diabolicus]|nr:hypothetical protein VDIAB_270761 [Vibrio diabolicus]